MREVEEPTPEQLQEMYQATSSRVIFTLGTEDGVSIVSMVNDYIDAGIMDWETATHFLRRMFEADQDD